MDYEEEQSNEIIVLESIYGDVMNIISDNPHEFTMDIKYSHIEGDKTTTENPPAIVLHCKYTETYPEELPEISIDEFENLPENEVNRLQEHLINLAKKELGTVMLYSVITAAQEWLNNFKDNLKREADIERAIMAKKAFELEMKKFEGTIVTKESFLNWKSGFDAERLNNKGLVQDISDKPKKLTGRELFMKDITMNESDLKFLEEDGETVKVDELLFKNLKDLEIDDE